MTRLRFATRFASFFTFFTLVLLVAGADASAATGTFSVAVYPQGLTFPTQAVETTSVVQNFTVYNVGIKSFTVNTATTNATQFKVVGGTLPLTLAPNQTATYQLQFTPDSAKLFSAQLTFTFTGAGTQIISLTGSGTNPSALPSLSTTSLNFGNQVLGANSPSQTLTITNTGSAAVKLTGVTVTYPFVQSGYVNPVVISAGKSLSLKVTFVPYLVGTMSGSIQFSYDIAPLAGVSLWGTATSPANLGVITYPVLPGGTIAASYQAPLNAAGGTPPYSWSLTGTSALPAGLTLSSSGLISGVLSSSNPIKTFSFSTRASDSSQVQQTASQTFLLSANKTLGADCNDIIYNAGDNSGPLVPITDLGTGSYLGQEEGGLYANGSNVDDPAHDAYGRGLAAGIQPLDGNGNPSATGKYVLLGVGVSVTEQTLEEFVPLATSDPAKNSNLVVVNGGTGGATAGALTSPANNVFWESIINDYLPNAGVTANQVVAIWFMDVDGGPSGTFPADMSRFQSEMETDIQNFHSFFPNAKILYASSFYYTGYSNGIKTLNPEPYAYESGFAVKNMIQDQINGNSNLNYDPTLGAVVAPWMAWGPYIWANGLLPRSDGTTWSCHDYQADGTHPNTVARLKASQQLLNFLKTDDTAAPWFLAPGSQRHAR